MRILLVGAGKVGQDLATHLTSEEHDVVIIDRNEDVLRHCEDTLDVLCVHGSGADAQTLISAGVDKTDIVIAATDADEVNMLCCLISKRLGSKYTIARIRDPQYNESLALLQRELGIDMVTNPERATAQEISRLLRFPFAGSIESFARGHVELVEFRAQEKDPVVGMPLRDVSSKHRDMPRVLFAAVERDGRVTIPTGDFIIHAEDRVFVAGDTLTITSFFRFLGKNTKPVRHVMIMGGGKISYYLAKIIVPMGIKVTMIEKDPDKAASLSESLPHVNLLCGDATDQELLEQEGIHQVDAFVALGDRDEENLMTGLFASKIDVPKVIVKNNRVIYADVIRAMGLESIVTPKDITTANILRYVRARINSHGTKVEKLYRLVSGKAEALEFLARPDDPYIGIPLKDLHMRPNTLVAIIVHRGRVIVPFGNDQIEAGDTVLIMAGETGLSDLNEIIRVH